jgi:hypothetical protein
MNTSKGGVAREDGSTVREAAEQQAVCERRSAAEERPVAACVAGERER